MRWREGGRPGAGMRARRRTGGAESCVKGVRDGGKARGRTVITGGAVSEETRWNWCGNWLIQGSFPAARPAPGCTARKPRGGTRFLLITAEEASTRETATEKHGWPMQQAPRWPD